MEDLDKKSLRTDVGNLQNSPFSIFCHQVSSWKRTLKIADLALRFVLKIAQRLGLSLKISSTGKSSEILAEKCVLLSVQREAYQSIMIPSMKTPIPIDLQNLSPYLDEFGLLSVGGRLQHSTLLHKFKFTIIVPRFWLQLQCRSDISSEETSASEAILSGH